MENPIVAIVYWILNIYVYILIASVILSWLFAFNVVNPYNQTVRQIYRAINMVTEPVLAPIRRMLPNLGGIDISPLVVLLVIQFLEIKILPWVFFKIGLL